MADGKAENVGFLNINRRDFLVAGASAGVLGAMGAERAFGQAYGQDEWKPDNLSLPPDIRQDLDRRAKLKEELPKPAGLRPNAQLDGRFPVSYQTSVAAAMKYLMD